MIKTAFSTNPSTKGAVNEIRHAFSDFSPDLVLFFASPAYSPQAIAQNMKDAFENARSFGCTTAGEIVSGKMLQKSVVAMAFDKGAMKNATIEVVQNISREVALEPAFESIENHFGKPLKEMSYREYVGIVLIDGMSLAEEKIMDEIGNHSKIIFTGGSAGDDLKFEKSYVFANGKAYSDAALLALLQPGTKFDFIKTQSFGDTGKKLKATKVNEATREVLEFDHKPALEAYAQVLGKQPNHELAGFFMKNPVGLMVGAEPFVRSPQRFDGKNMIFYCQIKEGMELSLLESTEIIADTRRAIAQKQEEIGEISAIINFNCILRTLELRSTGKCEEYGKIFTDIPTIGFSTYGEEFVGHINQTATMLVFK